MPGKNVTPFWRRVVNYVKDPSNAVALKFVLFAFGSGAISVYPFMVLQMKLIGFTIKEISLIYLAVPVGAFIGPIISGVIADRIGKYSLVVALNFFLTMISINLFLLVPHLKNPTTSLSCTEGSNCFINIPNCGPCLQATTHPVSFIFKNCKEDNFSSSSLAPIDEVLPLHSIKASGSFQQGCSFSMDNASIVDSNLTLNWAAATTCEIESSSECYEELKPLYSISFVAFLAIDFMVNFFMSASFTMSDAALLALAKQKNLKLGPQKTMLIVGFSITPIISGFLTDYHSKLIGRPSYLATFLVASVMLSTAGIVMLFLKIQVPTDSDNMWKNCKKLLTQVDIVLFFIILLTFGVCFGFIESYIFIFLQKLGANGFLLGLTLGVGSSSSIPLLYFEDKVENKLGRRNIYLICFGCYAIRMAGYSYLTNPWMGLIFETLEAFTYQLFWITSMKVFPILAPRSLLATMAGLSGAIHWCLGKGVGGFLGGYIINWKGYRVAFRIMALVSVAGGIFYFIIDKLILGKSLEGRERKIKEEEIEEAKLKEEQALLADNNQNQLPKVTVIPKGVEHSLLGKSSGLSVREVLTRPRRGHRKSKDGSMTLYDQ